MNARAYLSSRRLFVIAAAALACGALTSRPAAAQATISAEAGLDRFYKSMRWVPVQVTLTNQGAPVKVEVRARFATGAEGAHEYRLAERAVPSGYNQVHTLYMKAPASYGTQNLVLDFYRDGRLVNSVSPPLAMANDGDWVVVGIGPRATPLKQLGGPAARLSRIPQSFRARMMSRGNQPGQIQAAVLPPSKTPDRWQGLDAADMVIIDGASERDFTSEQMTALRDYANAGGLLVITGGVDWQRLTTPFFSELLPVQVTGARTATSLPGLSSFAHKGTPSGAGFGVCRAAAKPGAEVPASEGGSPLVAVGPKGSGRVAFVAFDPSMPPFSSWGGLRDFWQEVMAQQPKGDLLPLVSASDWADTPYYGTGSGSPRLATAPYSISQLDIPAFYIVALFLLAYIIVLVPLNYYFLKVRDKKEYAWLTTPAIVALFSVGAYVIGYGFKGGNTLMVKVGVVEAHAGQDSAPALSYAGLFSPRKTGYDIQLAPAENASRPGAPSTLLSEPPTGSQSPGLKVIEDDVQRIEDFGVDMWAMRVLKAEGIIRLGKGFTGHAQQSTTGVNGTVRNDTLYTLEDCRFVAGNRSAEVDDLPPGKSAALHVDGGRGATTNLSTAGLEQGVRGSKEQRRIRRAILQALGNGSGTFSGPPPQMGPLLIGWVKEPVTKLQVNGRGPRDQSATLMIVHLD